MNIVLEKLCTECKQIKSSESFYKDSRKKNGLQSRCKQCQAKRDKNRTDKEKRKIQKHNWWIKNREKNLILRRKWRENNKDYFKKYHEKHQFETYVKSSKDRKLLFDLTRQQFNEIVCKSCFYCGEFSKGKNYCGIDRIDSSKGYTIDNVVSCCTQCNYTKLDYTQQEYLEHCKKVTEYQNAKDT